MATADPDTAESPVVCVYRNALLPPSETFILAQVQAMRRWRPFLAGRARVADGLDLSDMDVVLHPAGMGRISRLLTGHMPYLGYAHPGFIASIRERRPRLVHAHFGWDAVHAWQVARRLAVPLLVTIHGYELAQRTRWTNPLQGVQDTCMWSAMRRLLRRPGVRVVAVSQFIRERVLALGVPAERVVVRYTGIDLDRFKRPAVPARTPGGPIILYVGRLVEIKACDDLLLAVASMPEPRPAVRIIGDGPIRQRCEHIAVTHGIRAVFLGVQPQSVVRDEMCRASVFCVPSKPMHGTEEAFGMAFVEAQAMGLPIVSTKSGGIPEAVCEGKSGILVAPRDIVSLRQALAEAIRRKKEEDRSSEYAEAWVRKTYDIRICTEKLEAYYDEVASPADPSRTS